MAEPKVFVQERSMFGKFSEEALQNPGITSSFIEGYSDKRTQAELERKKGGNPDPLPYRFHGVRHKKLNGTPDNRKVSEFKRMGYKPVMWEDAKELGINLENSSYEKAPDGSVELGDTLLMVCDAKTAASIDYAHQEKLRKQVENADAPTQLLDQRDEQNRPVFEISEE